MAKIKKTSKNLTPGEIKEGLKALPGWHYFSDVKTISAEYETKNFMAAVKAIKKIARLAEKDGHHPDLHLTRYRHLKIALSTHEAGGVTEKDFHLARQIKIKSASVL